MPSSFSNRRFISRYSQHKMFTSAELFQRQFDNQENPSLTKFYLEDSPRYLVLTALLEMFAILLVQYFAQYRN